MALRLAWAVATTAILAAPASAQVTGQDAASSGIAAAQTGGLTDPGGLSRGGDGTSGTSAMGTGAASNPGGLSLGRASGTGGGTPSAGISAGSTAVQAPDDTYLYPLYGKSFR